MSESELKPCPWCGYIPTIEYWHGGGPRKRMVHCVNQECDAMPAVSGPTAKKAIAAWNRRATVPDAGESNAKDARIAELDRQVKRAKEMRNDTRLLQRD